MYSIVEFGLFPSANQSGAIHSLTEHAHAHKQSERSSLRTRRRCDRNIVDVFVLVRRRCGRNGAGRRIGFRRRRRRRQRRQCGHSSRPTAAAGHRIMLRRCGRCWCCQSDDSGAGRRWRLTRSGSCGCCCRRCGSCWCWAGCRCVQIVETSRFRGQHIARFQVGLFDGDVEWLVHAVVVLFERRAGTWVVEMIVFVCTEGNE